LILLFTVGIFTISAQAVNDNNEELQSMKIENPFQSTIEANAYV